MYFAHTLLRPSLGSVVYASRTVHKAEISRDWANNGRAVELQAREGNPVHPSITLRGGVTARPCPCHASAQLGAGLAAGSAPMARASTWRAVGRWAETGTGLKPQSRQSESGGGAGGGEGRGEGKGRAQSSQTPDSPWPMPHSMHSRLHSAVDLPSQQGDASKRKWQPLRPLSFFFFLSFFFSLVPPSLSCLVRACTRMPGREPESALTQEAPSHKRVGASS